ncbi:MAG: S8 family serine peptidase [Actinomycetia bacterium]|nr:S8 family serine peptidase [Actinomycetes bacterium]
MTLALLIPAGIGTAVAAPHTQVSTSAQPAAQLPSDPSVRAKPKDVISDVDRGERVVVAAVAETSSGGIEIREQAVKGRSAAKAAVSDAQADPDVRAVEVAVEYRLLAADDPRRGEHWPLDQFAVEASVWPKTTGAGIKVAVVDSGVAGSHPDLSGQITSGADFVVDQSGNTPNTSDANGHGTHVAGVIAAVAGNGVGVAGLAPAARIIPVRVLDANGSGFSSDVADGIIFAADQGADVINLSLGGTQSSSVGAALEYAQGKGVTIVAAMGNEKQRGNPTTYPAADPETIAVAATDEAQQVAAFSNTGNHVDVAAPGVGILSTVPDTSYARFNGTSMATPHVAALAALVLAREPGLTPEQIRSRIADTAVDIGAQGWDSSSGSGVIDPAAATGKAPAPPSASPTPTPTPPPNDLRKASPIVPAPVAPVVAAKPEVTKDPEKDQAKKGKKVRFKASFAAAGDIRVNWRFKLAGEKRKLPGRATVKSKSDRTKLTIVGVKKKWSGAKVRAEVRNDAGVDRSRWARIRVL